MFTQSAKTQTHGSNPIAMASEQPTAPPIPPETPLPTPQATVAPTPSGPPLAQNSYSSLSVPTQITKIGEDYFLVDCYHNQILTSPTLDAPLEEWLVMSDQINRGHTIAGNGRVYVADDTENNRVLIFEKVGTNFVQTQVIEDVGIRPHYVEYDTMSERFYVLSSMSGELYVFRQSEDSSEITLDKILTIPDMQDVYIRSFTIDGEEIYFAASNGTILRAKLEDLSLLEKLTVPSEIAGLVQIVRIQEYYYLTVSTDLHGNADYATIIRTKELCNLADYGYEDMYTTFAETGTPYYISYFDEHYYLTQHCYLPGHGVWQFDVIDDELSNVTILYP